MKKGKKPVPPVIIIGMHRSGTSMITKLLGEAGLVIGNDIDIHGESKLFFLANEWILRLSGGAWDNPGPVHTLLGNQDVRDVVTSHLENYIFSFRDYTFLGLRRYLLKGSLRSMDRPWGWKDPRNSFTLPLWLALFPQAKIIHVHRHGVDVAQSLFVRQMRGISSLKNPRGLKRRLHYLFSPLPRYFLRSVHLTSVNEGVKLWNTYLTEEIRHLAEEKRDVLQVKYEDFLERPVEGLRMLVDFCGLDYDDGSVSGLVSKVNASRAYAYRKSETLKKIADDNASLLAKFGY